MKLIPAALALSLLVSSVALIIVQLASSTSEDIIVDKVEGKKELGKVRTKYCLVFVLFRFELLKFVATNMLLQIVLV